jgi:hypothetical protein
MDRNPSYPTPLDFRVNKVGDDMEKVALVLADTDAKSCKRCAVCTAVSSTSNPGQSICENVVPADHRDDFLFGPVDGATATTKRKPPKAKVGRRKRPRTKLQELTDAFDEMLAALEEERHQNILADTKNDQTIADEEEKEIYNRPGRARERLEAALVKVHGPELFRYSVYAPMAPTFLELDDTRTVMIIPQAMCPALDLDQKPTLIPYLKSRDTANRLP